MHPRNAESAIPQGTFSSYVLGFGLSVLLTLFSFLIAPHFSGFVYPAIILAALIQLVIQLVFFLHLGRESGPRWNLTVFAFTFIIIGIVVIGTLWIMQNLAHLHMPAPTTTDLYVNGIVAPQNELK